MDLITGAMLQENILCYVEDATEINIERYIRLLEALPKRFSMEELLPKTAATPPVSLRAVVKGMDRGPKFMTYVDKRTGEVITFSEDMVKIAKGYARMKRGAKFNRKLLAKARDVLSSEDCAWLPGRDFIREYSIREDFCESFSDDRTRYSELLTALRQPRAFGFLPFWRLIRQFKQITVAEVEDAGGFGYCSSRIVPSRLFSKNTRPSGPSAAKRRSARVAGVLPCAAFFSLMT